MNISGLQTVWKYLSHQMPSVNEMWLNMKLNTYPINHENANNVVYYKMLILFMIHSISTNDFDTETQSLLNLKMTFRLAE